MSDYHGRMLVSHTGGYDGMLSSVALIPDENLGVVVLTNGSKSPFMAATYYALDRFLKISPQKDWSKELLKFTERRLKKDTRISDRKAKRVIGTQPTILPKDFVGDYISDIYGKINVLKKGNSLKLEFSHSLLLSATLTHWHYNTWRIHWEYPQAWFSFGTIKFNTDNNLNVIGFDFDVPNDDFFFEELKPYKINLKKKR